MAAGSHRAGIGPAGAAPVRTSIALPNGGPMAAKFDPFTKSFPLDSNGNFINVHPVDQGIALALGVAAGNLTASPDTGHTLLKIRRGADLSRQKEAEDRVKQALSSWVSRGDIAIVSIETEASEPSGTGRIEAAVTYRNLRLGGTSNTVTTLI